MTQEKFNQIIKMIKNGKTFYFTNAMKSFVINKKNVSILTYNNNSIFIKGQDASYSKITYTN
jgi:hypothetical protein